MNLNISTVQSSQRTLLSNATACQVLGNIIAMQFYYGGLNYAYSQYDTILWDPVQQLWSTSSSR